MTVFFFLSRARLSPFQVKNKLSIAKLTPCNAEKFRNRNRTQTIDISKVYILRLHGFQSELQACFD